MPSPSTSLATQPPRARAGLACMRCACTEWNACVDAHGPCAWACVKPPVCTACARRVRSAVASDFDGRAEAPEAKLVAVARLLAFLETANPHSASPRRLSGARKDTHVVFAYRRTGGLRATRMAPIAIWRAAEALMDPAHASARAQAFALAEGRRPPAREAIWASSIDGRVFRIAMAAVAAPAVEVRAA